MTSDPASFKPEQIQAIYGERPKCFFTNGWQWVDGHHILGRGYDMGYPPGRKGRACFSSPYNFAPLQRDIHKGPARDQPEIRYYLLRVAREHVDHAIQQGSYQLTALDKEFLAIASEWTLENPI